MSISVTVRLDRTACILAGRTDFGKRSVIISDEDLATFSQDERTLLAERMRGDAEADLDNLLLMQGAGWTRLDAPDYPVLTEANLDAVHTVLAATAAGIEAHRKKQADDKVELARRWDERQREWLAKPDDTLLIAPRDPSGFWSVEAPDGSHFGAHLGNKADTFVPGPFNGFAGMIASNAVVQRLKALAQVAALRTEDVREQVKATRLAAAAQEKARQQAEEDALNRAVEERGTDGQRKRAKRGLLSQDERLRLYRDQVFAPLELFARYERITKDEINAAAEDSKYSDCDEYEFRVSEPDDVGSATDAEFATLEAIEQVVKERLPEGTVCAMREHSGGYEPASEWAVQRKSVMVTIPEPVKVSREFACP